MAYLSDSEGKELNISDLDGKKSWSTSIWADYDYNRESDVVKYTGLSISVNIPEYLTDGENEYSSCGLLTSDLSENFDEYLADVMLMDNGESLLTFSKILRLYADKADLMIAEISKGAA